MSDLNLDLSLPYVTDKPGVGGRIKKKSEHFIVEEIPLYNPEGIGSHLYVNITKKNITTRDVQLKLANLFELRPVDVGRAGLKDKYAVATQTFSILFQDHTTPSEVASVIEDNLPITVNWAKYHKNKLRSGHLLGNKFTIVISEPEGTLSQAKEIANKLNKSGYPNFYGVQRLGKHGENVHQGWLILKKQKRLRNRWLRRYLLSSYQSYLCNRYLVKRIEKGLFNKILLGDIAKKHETGGLFWVEDPETDQQRFNTKELSFTAPMFGYKMSKPKKDSLNLENQILSETGVDLQDFKAHHVKGTRRMGRVLPKIITSNHPDGIQLEFDLRKGGFATILLREFMKNDAIDS